MPKLGECGMMAYPRLRIAELAEPPLISVLLANYNYGHYIGEAIQSVLAQSYENWELIICDDGSVDSSVGVIRRFAREDSRIIVIEKTNGGVASALNRAFAACSGELICLLDADDTFTPEKLGSVVELARRFPLAGLFTTAVSVVDADGTVIARRPPGVGRDEMDSGWIGPRVVSEGGFTRLGGGSAISFRRSLGEYIFPIPEEEFRREADAYIFTLGSLCVPVSSENQTRSTYRLHDSNLTGRAQWSTEGLQRSVATKQRVAKSVNSRLRVSGSDLKINADMDPVVIRSQCILKLLEGDRPAAYSELVRYMDYLNNAVYLSERERISRFLQLFVAFAIPLRLREAWFASASGITTARQWIGKLI